MFKFNKGSRGFSIGKLCFAFGGKRVGVQISFPYLFRIMLHADGIRAVAYGTGFFEWVGWRVSAGLFKK
ncbi:MAG: hypothetical protein EBU82_12395 [Flavobacteriia bacterium]|nr:hypothetical protein [Flavobacteriia bacterium]